jgi:ABC-type branched-subunit amino acid transport system substrate-binding protein
MDGRLRIGACLSLSGRFAQFGRQAALGLQAWRTLDGNAELVIEDDQSDQRVLENTLPDVAERCDVLLGPYSTVLARVAGRVAADSGRLIWNHGGSGDDVQRAQPGHMVSILTPTSRYGEPFVRMLAENDRSGHDLCVVHGAGRFGRQVADGTAVAAEQLGITVVRANPDEFPPSSLSSDWDLFSAGVFEQDASLAASALGLPRPPHRLCTVSAGVRDFSVVVGDPEGVFGIAQWFPGSRHQALLGPSEEEFLHAYASVAGDIPDYPAVQAAAGASVAAHCARLTGNSRRKDLWAIASTLDTSTLFGRFRVDPASGTQLSHETTLVRWKGGKLTATPAKAPRPSDGLRAVDPGSRTRWSAIS